MNPGQPYCNFTAATSFQRRQGVLKVSISRVGHEIGAEEIHSAGNAVEAEVQLLNGKVGAVRIRERYVDGALGRRRTAAGNGHALPDGGAIEAAVEAGMLNDRAGAIDGGG